MNDWKCILIVRGRHAAVREGPNVQHCGAAGVTCEGHLCHQGGLPCFRRTGRPHRVAPRGSPPPQQPRGQSEQQGVRGGNTELQSHQGVPHLLRPGLSCSGLSRSGDQSRMWERISALSCMFLTKSGLSLRLAYVPTVQTRTENNDKFEKRGTFNVLGWANKMWK